MTRRSIFAAGSAGALLGLALGGWAAAGALRPPSAAVEGRGLQVRYEVVREPAYAPPPPAEATRLDVLDATPPTVVEDGVLSAQAGAAVRSLQMQDAARTAAGLDDARSQDASIDRETTAALAAVRDAASEPAPAAAPDPAA